MGNVGDANGKWFLDLRVQMETENGVLEPTDSVCTPGARTDNSLAVQGEDTVRILPDDPYVVWSSTDLSSGAWAQEQTVPSAGNSTSWTDPSPSGLRKFYMVQEL